MPRGGKRPAVWRATAAPKLPPPHHVVAPTEVAVDFQRDDLERGIRVEASASGKNVTEVEMGPIDLLSGTGGNSGRCER